MIRKTFLLMCALSLIVTVGLAKNLETGYEPEGLDELAKQKGLFKTTMIRPDADFSRYTKIYPKKVVLVVRDQGPGDEPVATGSLIGSRSRQTVMPGWEDLAELKEIINHNIDTQVEDCTDCELVHADGPQTLVVRVALTDVIFDESKVPGSPDGKMVPLLKQGIIVFDLIDGETGVIQARLGERRKCKPAKGAGITGPWPNVDDWAELAAEDFGRELKRMRGTG